MMIHETRISVQPDAKPIYGASGPIVGVIEADGPLLLTLEGGDSAQSRSRTRSWMWIRSRQTFPEGWKYLGSIRVQDGIRHLLIREEDGA